MDLDQGNLAEALQAELFPDSLQLALLNASEQNAHILETRQELRLFIARVLDQVFAPGGVAAEHASGEEKGTRGYQTR